MSYKMEAARRTGALAILLEEFEQEALPIHIVYPERRPMPLKLRAFLNWVTPRLKSRLAGDHAEPRLELPNGAEVTKGSDANGVDLHATGAR